MPTPNTVAFDDSVEKLDEISLGDKAEKEEAVIEVGGIIRPPMNQAEFDNKFSFIHPEEDTEFVRRLKKIGRSYYEPFTSWISFKLAFLSFVPILEWLPHYNWKEDLLQDVVGGLTVGIMHVPQGVAYAVLAKQDAVVGLYTSFFAPIFYMLFGTSRHNSIGSFAVVSLMTGLAVTKLTNIDAIKELEEEGLPFTLDDLPTPLEVASTLTLTVGLVQILMGFFRLSFLTTYFSDQLVAGFTTGASCHVFVSQLKDFFGLRKLPLRSGPGNVLMKLYDIISRIPQSNWVVLSLSLICLVILVVGKDYVNPFLKKKLRLPVPIPFELILVVGATAVSYLMQLNAKYNVKIVKTIPTGMPVPSLPQVSLMPHLITDAVGICIVCVAVHISLAKMFAKKLNYKVDPGQELWALGLTSVGCGFLPVYPVACSLGRTMVNAAAGTKTQLSAIFSSCLLLSVILYFGKLLEYLPLCVLSVIVIVALKGMAKKFADLPTLWPLSKIDFSIWIVSFLTTLCIDVMEGLAISILYALFTTVMREQWPRWHLLGNVSGTTDYRDSERYEDVYFFHGICIFRFDSPLLFTNVERFKGTVNKAYRAWQKSHEFYILRKERSQLLLDPSKLEKEITMHSQTETETNTESSPEDMLLSRHFIIDCSGFTFVDYMGVSALKEVYYDMRCRGILVYFAASKAPVRDLFASSGFYSFVAKENFYPTIRDAVAIARRTQQAKGHRDSLYTPEYDRFSEILSSHPMD